MVGVDRSGYQEKKKSDKIDLFYFLNVLFIYFYCYDKYTNTKMAGKRGNIFLDIL